MTLLLAPSASADVRLINPSNGLPLRWSQPSAVSIVFQALGCEDLVPSTHLPALRGAVRAWNGVEQSSFRLIENTSPGQMARTDWGSDALHMVLFDEQGTSGYFPAGSGLVALTLVWYGSSGVISDADILFNARDYEFSVTGEAWKFDVQDVATHELGHLAGFDHSGVAGSTMYPYVHGAERLHRSLAADDRHGLCVAYPLEAGSRLEGRLVRGSGTAVKGAHIVARAALGEPVASTLSNSAGEWTLQGLEAGTYTLYATPLDQPVGAVNLGPGRVIQTDFSTTPLGEFTLGADDTQQTGTRTVRADAALLLGRSMEQFPKRIIRGETQTVTISGSGLSAGCTIACSDPTVSVSALAWNTTHVNLSIDATQATRDGLCDLTVTQGQSEHTLVGGLELTPADPIVTTVSPASASSAGGQTLTITGSGLRSGLRVVIGEHEYPLGEAGGAALINATTLTLALKPMLAGSHPVVVIDPTGVEGRWSSQLLVEAMPRLDAVFPQAGWSGGGTELTLRGANFEPGVRVRIGGIEQSELTREHSGLLRVVTMAGVEGEQTLEVLNPGVSPASASFTYTNAVDPYLLAVSPASGPSSGGSTVFLHGENFRSGCTVRFGVDPVTGLGGKAATATIVRENGLLEVLTPAHSSGAQSVLVLDERTGQATLLAGAYTYHGSGSAGGGCSVVPYSSAGPGAGLGWLLALFGLLLRTRRARTA
jgi:hypothetical protein